MKVLKATFEQKIALEGTYKTGSVLRFIEDANNNWVVNDAVINDEDFSEIKEQLQALPLINYNPQVTTI